MSLSLIFALVSLGAPLAAQAPLPQAAAAASDLPAGAEKVRVAAAGAVVRNLNDANGRKLMELEAGTPLAVFSERAGWLNVEIPGGFPVWVFGKFLAKTSDANVFECTSNAVNLRPRAARNNSYPLGRLRQGDRVLVIERADATLPLKEDWVRIWSPVGVRAWIEADETADLPTGASAAKLWSDFSAKLTHRVPPAFGSSAQAKNASSSAAGTATSASSPVVGSPGASVAPGDPESLADAALEAAVKLEEAERAKPETDYSAVRAGFQAVIDLAPGGVSAQLARQRLETVAARESAAKLALELEAEKQRRLKQSMERNQEIWDRTRQKDPHFGRFAGRGVLERYGRAGETPRFLLRWGGEPVFDVVCTGGRYRLDLFTGFEVGIDGSNLLGEGELPQLDAEQIVVLSRR